MSKARKHRASHRIKHNAEQNCLSTVKAERTRVVGRRERPNYGNRGGIRKAGVAELFPNMQTMRHRCHLGIALKYRREGRNKIGHELLRCDAGPIKASWAPQKVLELDGLSELS